MWLREMEAEQSDRGNVDLLKSHDAPRALGQDQSGGRESRADAMEVEQELVTRKLAGKLPFAETCGECRVKSSAGIAERRAVGVVQSDADTPLEKALFSIKAGFETACSFGLDAFFPKKADVSVKSKSVREGAKGFRVCSNRLQWG